MEAQGRTQLRDAALAICAELRTHGYQALLAGGCVRDMLLEQTPLDYDIATDATAAQVQAIFPKTAPVGAEFGVVLVIRPEGPFEVATFRQDGPYVDGRRPESVRFCDAAEDARRRDFTINALFYDPAQEKVLDYVGGQADLEAGILRTVGDPQMRFAEDHLRLIRAVRFAARLDYQIESTTWEALQQNAPAILRCSAERLRDELCKILTQGNADRALDLLDASGLLEQLLPEVAAMKGVEQPPVFHPEGDVYTHTRLLLRYLQPPTVSAPSVTLAMGALLHDVGKPLTQTFEDRIRFNNHHHVGADMARTICQRLRFSKKATERIAWLVDQHMRVADIPEMKENRRRRFVREPGFEELLTLCRLDCLASHGDTATVDWIADYIEALGPEEETPPPLLSGKDLIALGLTPGPHFAEILRFVEEEQLEGHIESREAAIEAVLERWRP